ncbi:hypothetical protein BDV95DRAFT_665405 [Massariosphaeria phaeospora]|uniref:Uncharacterized protein n=1 Tax=Massariosphaeria phaeospora TaxID=100035 RepID=A0A7C8MBZ3_9PLEO|nr:hypothetical protein BDV95DRAFT_665405 [Massariosphaeria phaeospora]
MSSQNPLIVYRQGIQIQEDPVVDGILRHLIAVVMLVIFEEVIVAVIGLLVFHVVVFLVAEIVSMSRVPIFWLLFLAGVFAISFIFMVSAIFFHLTGFSFIIGGVRLILKGFHLIRRFLIHLAVIVSCGPTRLDVLITLDALIDLGTLTGLSTLIVLERPSERNCALDGLLGTKFWTPVIPEVQVKVSSSRFVDVVVDIGTLEPEELTSAFRTAAVVRGAGFATLDDTMRADHMAARQRHHRMLRMLEGFLANGTLGGSFAMLDAVMGSGCRCVRTVSMELPAARVVSDRQGSWLAVGELSKTAAERRHTVITRRSKCRGRHRSDLFSVVQFSSGERAQVLARPVCTAVLAVEEEGPLAKLCK